MQNYRWDDLQVLAALMRSGSQREAAARLSVNVSTVSRRLDGLEERLAVRLFDRGPEGVVPTAAAEALFPIAEAMEERAADVYRVLEGYESEPDGLVRVSAPPAFLSHFVAPWLPALRRQYPKLRLELDGDIGYADLTRHEADIALRVRRPTSGDLVAVKIGSSKSAILVAKRTCRRLTVLTSITQLPFVSWTAPYAHLPSSVWLRDAGAEIFLRSNHLDAQIAAAEAGVGAIVLGRVHIDRTRLVSLPIARSLKERLPAFPSQDLWLVGHRALRDVPRVAAVWDFLLEKARSMVGTRVPPAGRASR